MLAYRFVLSLDDFVIPFTAEPLANTLIATKKETCSI